MVINFKQFYFYFKLLTRTSKANLILENETKTLGLFNTCQKYTIFDFSTLKY